MRCSKCGSENNCVEDAGEFLIHTCKECGYWWIYPADPDCWTIIRREKQQDEAQQSDEMNKEQAADA